MTDEKKTSNGGTNGWDVLMQVVKTIKTFLRDFKWPLCVVAALASLQLGWLDIPIFETVFTWVVEVMKAGASLIPGVG